MRFIFKLIDIPLKTSSFWSERPFIVWCVFVVPFLLLERLHQLGDNLLRYYLQSHRESVGAVRLSSVLVSVFPAEWFDALFKTVMRMRLFRMKISIRSQTYLREETHSKYDSFPRVRRLWRISTEPIGTEKA